MSADATPPASSGERSLAQIIAEAKADSQEPAAVEPFVMVLTSGRKIPFRNPSDIPLEDTERAADSFVGQLRLLLANPRDWRALWAEIKHVPQRYVGALVDSIITHYEEQGKGGGSST